MTTLVEPTGKHLYIFNAFLESLNLSCGLYSTLHTRKTGSNLTKELDNQLFS